MASSANGSKQPYGSAMSKLSTGYEAYPLHTLDQFKALRYLLTWVVCFNDVLDAEKLRASLARLFEIEDWRKLGARIERQVHALKYEYCFLLLD